MGLKFRRGSTAQQSGSLAFGEPYVNTTLGTLVVGGATGDIVLSAGGTGSTGNFGAISGSGLDITGNANIGGNLTVGGQLQIGDQTSDTVNVVASLSSSLIPQTTNAFDLGSATKIWRDLYISTGSIKFVEGTSVVGTFNNNTLTSLLAATGSSNESLANLNTFTASANTRLTNLETKSASVDTSVSNLNTTTASLNTSVSNLNSFSSSQLTQNSALATISGSLISTASANVGRLNAIEAVSGTFARTNSTNTFNGDQTISGSLFVTSDLIVGGSSSIQNISSSNLVIGAAYVTLNTFSPSSRYAGLIVVDSGSVGGSGSIVYDAVQDEVIFIHKGNGTNVTSSHFVMGPETIDNLGNETYLTNNKLVKGTGKEHIVDSNITDNGTLITLGSNAYVNGTFYATGTVLVSGSAQVTALLPTGVVSGSSQIDATATTNWSTGIKTQLNSNTVISGSSQVDATATTNWSTGIKTRLDANTVVSGSSQITLSSTTGYGTVINQNVLTTSDVRHNSLGIGMAASATAGRIDASGDIVAYSTSDKNFKENITPIPNAIEKIRKISGNTYDWKSDMKEFHGFEGNDVGVIAQEIEEVLPQLVTTRETGYKAVKYDKLVALLIEGIKEQQQHIDNLTIQVEELKKAKGL